jgi:arsenite/tail-anchored protein-transporting ATPase
MRTVLVCGPGGCGRTTVAAATAVQAARSGARTLLLTVDPADSAGGALGTHTGNRPVTPAPGLTVLRPDPAARFRADLLARQQSATSVLEMFGAVPFDDDELTALPGSTELALLCALRDAAAAPGAHAVLVLPEQLRRYLRRLLPPQRQAARALHPLLGRLAGVPLPTEGLYEAAARWDLELAMVQSVIEDPDTTVRLVAEPGEAGDEAVRTTGFGLALYGVRMDAVIANRVLPETSTDPWFAQLAAQQRKTLDDWSERYAPPEGADLPGQPRARLHRVGHLGRDPRGLDDLAALTESLPGRADPRSAGNRPAPEPPVPSVAERYPSGTWPVVDRRAADGVLVWHIPLPGARREELDLVRRGDELVVTAGPFRRVVDLPSALRRCTVDGAGLADGELRVRFRPDPALWPRGV